EEDAQDEFFTPEAAWPSDHKGNLITYSVDNDDEEPAADVDGDAAAEGSEADTDSAGDSESGTTADSDAGAAESDTDASGPDGDTGTGSADGADDESSGDAGAADSPDSDAATSTGASAGTNGTDDSGGASEVEDSSDADGSEAASPVGDLPRTGIGLAGLGAGAMLIGLGARALAIGRRRGSPSAQTDVSEQLPGGSDELTGSEHVPVARAVHDRRGDRIGLEQNEVGRGADGQTEAGVLGQCRTVRTGARHELRTSAGGDVEAAFDVLIAAEPVRERQLPGAPQRITVAVGAPVVALPVLAEPEGQPTFGDRRLRQHCLGRSDGGQADARLIEEVEDPVDLGVGVRIQGEGVRDRHLTGHRQSLRALDDLLEGEDPGGAGLVQMDVDALAVLLGQIEHDIEVRERVPVVEQRVEAADEIGPFAQRRVEQLPHALLAHDARLRERHDLEVEDIGMGPQGLLDAVEPLQPAVGVDLSMRADAGPARGDDRPD